MFSVKRSLVGLIALLLGLLCAWMPNVSQAQKECAAMKRYYLSANMVKGNEVTKVCREGFHTASLWELFDTSNLEYATEFGDGSLGLDKGSGPPSGVYGWVRTGWAPGFGGTVVGLPGKHIVFFGPAIHRRFPERGFDLPMIGERSGLLSHELDRGKRSPKSATTGIGCGACKIKFLDWSLQPAG